MNLDRGVWELMQHGLCDFYWASLINEWPIERLNRFLSFAYKIKHPKLFSRIVNQIIKDEWPSDEFISIYPDKLSGEALWLLHNNDFSFEIAIELARVPESQQHYLFEYVGLSDTTFSEIVSAYLDLPEKWRQVITDIDSVFEDNEDACRRIKNYIGLPISRLQNQVWSFVAGDSIVKVKAENEVDAFNILIAHLFIKGRLDLLPSFALVNKQTVQEDVILYSTIQSTTEKSVDSSLDIKENL